MADPTPQTRPHTLDELGAKMYPTMPDITPPAQPARPTGPQTEAQLARGMYPDAGGELRAQLRPFMSARDAEQVVSTTRQAWTRDTARPAALKLLAAEFGEDAAKDALAAAGAMSKRLPADVVARIGNNPHAVLALAKAAKGKT